MSYIDEDDTSSKNKNRYPAIDSGNQLAEKWTQEIIDRGFTVVPNALLEFRQELGLTATDLLVLICIERFRWYSHDPWPSVITLAELTGLSPRTISRSTTRMEHEGIIEKHRHFCKNNTYDLGWLPVILNDYLHDKYGCTATPRCPVDTRQYDALIINNSNKTQLNKTYFELGNKDQISNGGA